MKEKFEQAKKIGANAEDILNAVALSTTTGFAGYEAYLHRGNGIQWILLGVAAAWSVIQAFIAWSKVLNK